MSEDGAYPALGVGRMLSESVSILVARFPLLFALAFAVQIVFQLLAFALAESPFSFSRGLNLGLLVVLVTVVTFVVANTLTNGMLVLAAYDAKLGNEARVGAYLGATLNALGALIGYAILVALAAVVVLAVLFLLPGFLFGSAGASIVGSILAAVLFAWGYTVLAVAIPSMVIEGTGLSAIGRSFDLTDGHRWGIFGFLLVVGLGAGLFEQAGGAMLGLFVGGSYWLAALANAVIAGIAGAFAGVTLAVLFARLKEIKEGREEDLGEVFD